MVNNHTEGGKNALGKWDRLILGNLELGKEDNFPQHRIVQSYIGALLQSEHLNLLVGAGLTTAVSLAAGASGSADMNTALETFDKELDESIEQAATDSARKTIRGTKPNIEDRLRVAYTVQHGLEIIGDTRASAIQAAIDQSLTLLRQSVINTEDSIRSSLDQADGKGQQAVGLLSSFLASFAGRTPTRDRLHLFTTNYDRVIEWGAEQVGLRILDRFVGSLEPVFRSSRLEVDYHYAPPGAPNEPRHLDGIMRFTKLHGSLDWAWRSNTRQVVRRPVPFGEMPSNSPSDLLIYPNAAKDTETTLYPYSDLFRDFSAALCRPNSTLVTYGYSFGDDHINRIIRDMLTVPSAHLLIISYGDEGGRVSRFIDEYQLSGQVSLMLGDGFADLGNLTSKWLPYSGAVSIAQAQANILGATAQLGDGSEESTSSYA